MVHWNEIASDFRREAIPCAVQERLAHHTSFQIGGPARLFCEPQNKRQLARALAICRSHGARYYLLGNGTNVLFADEGFDGVVIHIGGAMAGIVRDGRVLRADAGAPLSRVCVVAANEGLSGLEFAFGIPGCVGGAVYMNAGAYGGEIKDVLVSASFLDETGAERTLSAQELQLGYRTSIFEHQPWSILSASFLLRADRSNDIRMRMADFGRRRTEKQPLEMPSAGSTFKRPQGAYAGALIDQCGLRGCAIGGAQISEKHCGFIVNTGNATCADVLSLADVVCKIVTEQTGFVLEKEIRVVR